MSVNTLLVSCIGSWFYDTIFILSHATTYSYDGSGNLAVVTDPMSMETDYTYDKLYLFCGRIVDAKEGCRKSETYKYNLALNLVSVHGRNGLCMGMMDESGSYGYASYTKRLVTGDTSPQGEMLRDLRDAPF